MSIQEVQVIGPFAKGEQPDPLRVTFQDADGNAISVAGYQVGVSFSSFDADASSHGGGSVSIEDGPNGIVQYTWAEADFDVVGTFRMQLWAGSGSLKYASKVFKYTVEEATPEATLA